MSFDKKKYPGIMAKLKQLKETGGASVPDVVVDKKTGMIREGVKWSKLLCGARTLEWECPRGDYSEHERVPKDFR